MSVFYLFTRFQFNWNEVQFSIFSTYNMLTGLIGKAQISYNQTALKYIFKINKSVSV